MRIFIVGSFFHDKNNKCEGETRRLKEILNTDTSLSVAVRLLFDHSVSQQFESFNIAASDLYAKSNRWLRSNVIAEVSTAQVAPDQTRQLAGPEARHLRTEAMLGRLSCLLKLCGSVQFEERIGLVEKVVNAWEASQECVVFVNSDMIASATGDVVIGVDGSGVSVTDGSDEVADVISDVSGDVVPSGSGGEVRDVVSGSGDVVPRGSGAGNGDIADVVGSSTSSVVAGGSGNVAGGNTSSDVYAGGSGGSNSSGVVAGSSGDVGGGEGCSGSGDVGGGSSSSDFVAGVKGDEGGGSSSSDVLAGGSGYVGGGSSSHVVGSSGVVADGGSNVAGGSSSSDVYAGGSGGSNSSGVVAGSSGVVASGSGDVGGGGSCSGSVVAGVSGDVRGGSSSSDVVAGGSPSLADWSCYASDVFVGFEPFELLIGEVGPTVTSLDGQSEARLSIMAPNKKKDRGKAFEWLQCSLCGKLISQENAEGHSASCSYECGYIQNKVFHGKVINAETLLGEDGTSVTKSIRDRDSAVWLAIQTMQMCGLSIGQPCVVNKQVIKRTWPHKSMALSSVALSQPSLKELSKSKDDYVSVERYVPDDATIATSVKLNLTEDNPLFETDEFAAFTSGYLDGKFITEGSPLIIRYFGQVCHCYVASLSYLSSVPISSISQGSSEAIAPSTPLKSTTEKDSSLYSTPVSTSSTPDDNALKQTSSPDNSLSDSIASLKISSPCESPSLTSTPKVPQRQHYPNLVTPVRAESHQAGLPSLPVFARVSSEETVFSVIGLSAEESNEVDSQRPIHQLCLDDVGGLSTQIKELKTRITRALHAGSSTRCLLLYGPAGTGKSLLIKALMADLGLPTMVVAGTDIWSKLFGEAESNLRKIFKTAQERAPSIIVIDDIDVICPKRSQSSSGQQEHRIVGTLLSLIDDMSSKKNMSKPLVLLGVTNNKEGLDPALRRAGRFGCEIEIGVPTAPQRTEKNMSKPLVLLGVTNNKEGLDPALRRAGRFGCEIEIGVPTAPQRTQILHCLLRHIAHTLSEVDIGTVAANAHGYVGADLAALINEASLHALTSNNLQHGTNQQHNTVSLEDLVYAGLHVKPSALREIQLEVPQVHWSDIGGMSEVKMRLREAAELPLSHPEVFKNLGIEPPRGLLMYGPPGCSKTMVARALATECKLNFLAVKGPELFNQYVGESEKAIREVFRKARSAAPSIIFFDEIDAIAAKRGSSSGGSGVDDRVLTQLLTEMDGLEFLKDVFIMAATNRPDKIDNALLRPGRFDSLVYVPLPDASTRHEILQKKFQKMAVGQSVSLEALVRATEDYSGAEVIQVCQEAALCALRENLKASTVQQQHFEAALEKVKPQISPELLQIYNKFSQAIIK
ncbi:spermatogenesis-associated protein 5-like [Plakobranchus ocellatus]|uniref:Spermatogenesis-associated protein 5-like n=1 Tax=Plakobranchus ocellatus TaxID=259542 RepID=A0AAV3YHQ5_9GAST|nr:spermatogenesis-associated protein 5-like [Plakobranchus ocellatus]